jgi:hypothetical protein
MGRKLLRLLAEDNPFYLLSSLSMLIGCYTLSHALAVRPGQTAKLLVLLTTLNVYELLVIALALLLVRRGVARDGRMLLQLEVLFLVDATLLDGEAFATDFATGAWVSAAALGLAVLKLLAILRALDRDSVARILPPALLSLGALFAIPGTFSRLTELGLLSPQALYAAWWAGAATVVAQALAARGTTPPAGDGAVVARAFERALTAALPASVVVHLVSTAWVYDLEFHVAHVGPMVLALGVARILDGQRREPFARLLLPAAAVVLSLGAPSELVLSGPGGIPISPLRATLFAAAVACVVAYRLHRAAVFAWAAAGCLFAGALGHSLGAMATTVGTFWTGVRHAGRRVVPRTAESWGVVAVVWAFVLLGAGAATSLLRGTVPPPRSRRP